MVNRNLIFGAQQETRVGELRNIVVPQKELKESPPGWKERRSRAKNEQKGRQRTPAATCFTAPILEHEEKLRAERDAGKVAAPREMNEAELAKFKKKIFEKQYNANKFDMEYLGKSENPGPGGSRSHCQDCGTACPDGGKGRCAGSCDAAIKGVSYGTDRDRK